MFRISNNDFKILIKYKDFMMKVDNVLENVPRRDLYYKDKLRSVLDNLLKYIFVSSYEININNIESYRAIIKSDIAMIDFMLDRLHTKKILMKKHYIN